jgi:hypothetical protein
VDHDDVDPSNWVHRPVEAQIPAEGGFLSSALERLEEDFQRIIGRRVRA